MSGMNTTYDSCVNMQGEREMLIKHIDTLPKYGKKTLDVRRST